LLAIGQTTPRRLPAPKIGCMSLLKHWHPVLLSSDLQKKPVGVRVGGQNIVLWRTPSGQLGALEDYCPHRRMTLSLGRVVGEKLMCLYHGWTYDCQGAGESPATPKLYACAKAYDAIERHGAIWVKEQAAAPTFPPF